MYLPQQINLINDINRILSLVSLYMSDDDFIKGDFDSEF